VILNLCLIVVPQQPRNISVESRTETILNIKFFSPEAGEFSHYFVSFKLSDSKADEKTLPVSSLPSNSTETTVS